MIGATAIELVIPSIEPAPRHIIDALVIHSSELEALKIVLSRAHLEAIKWGLLPIEAPNTALHVGALIGPTTCLAWGATISLMIETDPRWIMTQLTPTFDQADYDNEYDVDTVMAATLITSGIVDADVILTPLERLFVAYMDRAGELRRLLFAAAGSGRGLEVLEWYG